jgi:hypothetical protein
VRGRDPKKRVVVVAATLSTSSENTTHGAACRAFLKMPASFVSDLGAREKEELE